jgi:hypothetical protein
MDLEKKPVVSDVGAWGLNVVSSVGIIMANKQLMSPNGYAFCFGKLLDLYRSIIPLFLMCKIEWTRSGNWLVIMSLKM